jgi:hypothetical protein
VSAHRPADRSEPALSLLRFDAPRTQRSNLRCVQCGLVCPPAEVAREMPSAIGIRCRHCAGEPERGDGAPVYRGGVLALRASLSGWRHPLD